MDSQRVIEKFDKLPPKRKQVLLKVLANESKQKIALELCNGSTDAVQQHLRQLYNNFHIKGDRERKLPALIQRFASCMPELINNRVPGVINDLPHEMATAKLHQESDEMAGTSASELSPEQVVLDQFQPNHSLLDQEKNTPDASHRIGANSFLEYFSKAIDQLESKHIHVRIGAISSLGKLAKFSRPEDHWTVMEYLADFIRNAPPRQGEEGIPDDIQAALTVIGRRDSTKDPPNQEFGSIQRLNLRYTNLGGADLRKADMKRVILTKANLQKAALYQAKLRGATLSKANLQEAKFLMADLQVAILFESDLQSASLSEANLHRANLSGANLKGANLSGANLKGANLSGANLKGAVLRKANLQGAFLRGTDFTNAKDLEQCQIESAHWDSTTTLPEYFERPRH